ncbi:MAG: hypothetical protein LBQ31_10980 [Bacteroidales bacterium]|jgi:hypothetical protein|nr:hypothetical protein [Bacteroidales bacterium]
MSNTVLYSIDVNGNSVASINKVDASVSKLGKTFNKLYVASNRIAQIGFAFHHVMGAIKGVNSAVSGLQAAYEEEQVAVNKLAQVMSNTMGLRRENIQSVLDLTAAQQKLGVIGDEIQLSGAQELSTYLTKKSSLEKLLPAMNDMLAQQYGLNATQEQAANIGMMLGKVMQGQTSALSRYGYAFDDVREHILKTGAKAQKRKGAEAQRHRGQQYSLMLSARLSAV